MPPPSQKVLSWLYNVLTSGYINPDRVYTEIVHTISANPWILLRTDVYTDDNGRSSLLLNLYGNLSIYFRGSSYAVPISIWVPHSYPYTAPMSFVTAASGMDIRPGQHTRGDGRIYHPYLANWRDETSTVSGLIAVLQDVYSREPPVVAHQGQNIQPTAMARQHAVPPPVPPLPAELGRSSDGGSRAAVVRDRPPPPPPPPPRPADVRRQITQHIDSANVLPHQAANTSSAYTMSQQTAKRGHVNVPQRSQNIAYPSRDRAEEQYMPAISPSGSSPSWVSDGAAQDPSLRPAPTSYASTQAAPSSELNMESKAVLREQRYPASPSSIYHQSSQSHGDVRDRQRPIPSVVEPNRATQPADLLTSPFEATLPVQVVNAAPPPVPSNPQKSAVLASLSEALTELVRSIHASNMSAVAPLRAQQAALSSTLKGLENEITQLDQLEATLTDNESILRRAMQDADKVLGDAKQREIPNVDEVLFAPTVVARQLYELVAEERAIEDCRNILAKALDRGRVGASVWAKQTRGLAREEFLKKALIKKISTGMGLMEDQHWR